MIDKGFDIDEVNAAHITLYVPPKLTEKRKQFSGQEVESTKASAHVHVERAIQRFKMFQIVSTKVSSQIAPFIDEITTVICGLVNLSSPILKNNRF